MANLKVLDGDGNAKYLLEAGAGTDVDPHIPSHKLTDGTTTKPVIVIDADTGGGVQNVEAVLIAVPASGGVVAVPGDATNGLKVQLASPAAVPVTDNDGTLTVDGTVTVQDGGGAITVDNGGTFAVQASIAAAQTLATVTTVGAVTGITNALPAGDNNIGNVDIVSLPASTNTLEVVGDVATGSAAAGNPVLTGGVAVSALPAVVDANDARALLTDLQGRLLTLPYANPENFVSGVTAAITDTTRTSVIGAQAAGVRTYVITIIVTNSHATVGTFVKIEDGTTEKFTGYAAAVGGGFAVSLPVPLVGTAQTAWNASCVTTGANVIVSLVGFKAV